MLIVALLSHGKLDKSLVSSMAQFNHNISHIPQVISLNLASMLLRVTTWLLSSNN